MVVLDNYAVHRSKLVQAVQPALAAAAVHCYYLPPYSPELNDIEPRWRHVTYEELPIRSHTTAAALTDAVDRALDARAAGLQQSTKELCEAA